MEIEGFQACNLGLPQVKCQFCKNYVVKNQLARHQRAKYCRRIAITQEINVLRAKITQLVAEKRDLD